MFVCEQRLKLYCFKINLKQKLPLYNVHITVHVQCTDNKDDKADEKITIKKIQFKNLLAFYVSTIMEAVLFII